MIKRPIYNIDEMTFAKCSMFTNIFNHIPYRHYVLISVK
jgi:hypothetical protein